MINKVIFAGRATAETCGPFEDWALISIGEPDATNGPAVIKDGWHDVLRLCFHDVDPNKSDNRPYTLMQEADATLIIEFVQRNAVSADVIFVHCRAGISRSAAVAKWIASHYKLSFDHGYTAYNEFVYNLLCEAAGEDSLS